MAEARTSFYFIVRDGSLNAYELSATTDIRIRKPQTVTNRRVESGKSIADNAYMENTTIDFDGIITNIKNKSNVVDTDQFIAEVNQIREDKILVDVVAENQVFPRCLIPTFELSKSHVEGKGGWKVNISFQQVQFTNRASLVEVPEPRPAEKPDVDGTTKQSNNTVQTVDREVTRTLTGDGLNLIVEDNIPVIKSNIPTQGGG